MQRGLLREMAVSAGVVFFLAVVLVGVSSQTAPAPSAVTPTDCKSNKYNEWLQLRATEDGDTNQEKLDKLENACRKQLDDLTRQMFGPPTLYKRWTVACNTQCLEWDSMQEVGRTVSECTCEELKTCEDTPMFWLCKYMYECRPLSTEGLKAHRDHFCDGCGTGQSNEVDFYDELDCGRATFESSISVICLIVAVITSVANFILT